MKRDVDTRATAAFLVASIEGAIGLTEATKDRGVMRSHLGILADYLETLRTRR